MYKVQNENITKTGTLTDAGTTYLNPANEINDAFKGKLIFAITAVQDSGTTAGTYQLQGSADGTNFIDIGSTVAIAVGTVLVELSGTELAYNYYRIEAVGSGTQSTSLSAVYNLKKEV
jgi:Tfp pilus assembly protein PilX